MEWTVHHVNVSLLEVMTEYCAALRDRHFVILAGPADVDKMSLAYELARNISGSCAPRNWCALQGHAWWTTGTGRPAKYALAQAQLTFLKLSSFIELAAVSEPLGVPFFVGIRRISPAEAVSFFCDLPQGWLWRADASRQRICLPSNLYVTGTFNLEGERGAFSSGVYEHSAVVYVKRADPTQTFPLHGGSLMPLCT